MKITLEYSIELHFDEGLYTLLGSPDYFEIEFLAGDEVKTEQCKSVRSMPKSPEPYYSFKIIDDTIGFIDMNSLESYRDFKEFCKTTFKQINDKRIRYLIIDFRGNGGGHSKIGDELMKYISNVPFSQYEKVIIKISKVSRRHFHYPLRTNTLFEKKLSRRPMKPYPEQKRFSGSSYILVDGGTFSSAGSTVWCIDHYEISTSIGEETGGLGVHFGHPITRTLPVTGLTYHVSHRKWYQVGTSEQTNSGLIPDYIIEPTPEDFKNHRDPVLEFTLDLIRTDSIKE